MKMFGLRSTAAELLRYISAALLIIMLSLSCAKNGDVDDPEKPEKPGTEQPEEPDEPQEPDTPEDPEDPEEPEEETYIPPAVTDHIIGYLAYTAFEHAFFDELLEAFDDFKEYGVTDLVLDLRYNGGGHVISSQGLGSVIAGPWCKGKVFAYERYNDERMKKAGCDPANYKTYDYRMFIDELADRYSFNFSKVYVIVTSETASASELLINALRGIGYNVVVVGHENSIGKDVGMEIPGAQKIGNYNYQPVVISFQSYNAKGESDYDNGFKPDLKTTNYLGYYPGYFDWGLPVDWGMSMKNDDATRKDLILDYIIDVLKDINNGNDYYINDVQRLLPFDDPETEAAARTRTQLPAAVLSANAQPNARTLKKKPGKNPLKQNMVIMRDNMELPQTRAMNFPATMKDVNKDWTDPWMDNYYLWNDAYRQTKKDYSLAYDEFLYNVLEQMYEMGVNKQDGYAYQYNNQWYWEFFSYIDRWSAVGGISSSMSGVTRGEESNEKWDSPMAKDKVLGFGMWLQPTYAPNNNNRVVFFVDYVYPGSPADNAGIKRGDCILKIDNKTISSLTWNRLYANLLYDEFTSSTTYTFTMLDKLNGGVSAMKEGEKLTVTTESYYPNPVVFRSIYRFTDHNK